MTTAKPNKPKTHRKTPRLNNIFDMIEIQYRKKCEKIQIDYRQKILLQS